MIDYQSYERNLFLIQDTRGYFYPEVFQQAVNVKFWININGNRTLAFTFRGVRYLSVDDCFCMPSQFIKGYEWVKRKKDL